MLYSVAGHPVVSPARTCLTRSTTTRTGGTYWLVLFDVVLPFSSIALQWWLYYVVVRSFELYISDAVIKTFGPWGTVELAGFVVYAPSFCCYWVSLDKHLGRVSLWLVFSLLKTLYLGGNVVGSLPSHVTIVAVPPTFDVWALRYGDRNLRSFMTAFSAIILLSCSSDQRLQSGRFANLSPILTAAESQCKFSALSNDVVDTYTHRTLSRVHDILCA